MSEKSEFEVSIEPRTGVFEGYGLLQVVVCRPHLGPDWRFVFPAPRSGASDVWKRAESLLNAARSEFG